jgi:hypothetical protein
MRLPSSGVWLTALAAATAGCSRAAAAPQPVRTDAGEEGFAVVELFTSEGCSSCPPADEVLHEIAVDAVRKGQPVFPLAFHVDYWDDLGWPDPFGMKLATSRQQAYARALGERGLYTPQMVVNGRDAFVGSDRSHANRSISAATDSHPEPPPVRIDLRAAPAGDRVAVDFALSNAPAPSTVLQVALVQLDAVSQVKAGENRGRTLRHANVVRAFQTVLLEGQKSGHTALSLPKGEQARGDAVIAFLQDSGTMAVRGATRFDLASTASQ